MQPPFFFAPPEALSDDIILLPTDESKHAVSVLRLKPGELVLVVDGLGNARRGAIDTLSPKGTTVRVLSQHRNMGEPSVRLTLAAGLSTASKFDVLVQKGTEVGVSRFVPVITDRSKVKIEDPKKARSKVSRLERVALAAMKQCRRSYRPDIAAPITLTDFLAETDPDSANLIFHPSAEGMGLSSLDLPPQLRRLTVLIGPESGFGDQEVALAEGAGFRAVSLGERVLRTETAGPVIAALVLAKLGEYR